MPTRIAAKKTASKKTAARPAPRGSRSALAGPGTTSTPTSPSARPSVGSPVGSHLSASQAARRTLPSLHDLHEGPRRRSSIAASPGSVRAHFGELGEPLSAFIRGSEVVLGCVAWITDREILRALASRTMVSLVVQKEDWWKKNDLRGEALQKRYAALTGGVPMALLPAPLAARRSLLPAIACVGYGATKSGRPSGAVPPLMHHKFIVRAHYEPTPGGGLRLVPTAVWTGSFNFSGNAKDSFENAVEIHDRDIAAAYLSEFSLVAALSEPMDWRLGRPVGARNTEPSQAATAPAKKAPAKKPAAKKTTGTKPAAARASSKRAPAAKTAATKTAAKKTAAKKTVSRGAPRLKKAS